MSHEPVSDRFGVEFIAIGAAAVVVLLRLILV